MRKFNLFLIVISTAFLTVVLMSVLLTYQADIETKARLTAQTEILERYIKIVNPETDGEYCAMERIIYGECYF